MSSLIQINVFYTIKGLLTKPEIMTEKYADNRNNNTKTQTIAPAMTQQPKVAIRFWESEALLKLQNLIPNKICYNLEG